MRLPKILLSLAFAMACATLYADDKNSKVTTFNNNDIYEVVVDENTGEKTRSGIYRINKKSGESELILPGKVLGVNRAYKGVLSWVFPETKSQTEPAFTIIDERLVLFNSDTNKPKVDPKSLIEFGGNSPSSVAITDPLNGRRVQLPSITNIEDIVIHHVLDGRRRADSLDNGRVIIISVKSPSILGKGLTFAARIIFEGKSEKLSIEKNSAVVLDYDFYPSNRIGRLVKPDLPPSESLISPIALNGLFDQLSQKAKSSKAAASWAKEIQTCLDYLESENAKLAKKLKLEDEERDLIPTFNISTRKLVMENLPVDHMTKSQTDDYKIGLVYDPQMGREYLMRLDPNDDIDVQTSLPIVSARAARELSGFRILPLPYKGSADSGRNLRLIPQTEVGIFTAIGPPGYTIDAKETFRHFLLQDSAGKLHLGLSSDGEMNLKLFDLGINNVDDKDSVGLIVKDTQLTSLTGAGKSNVSVALFSIKRAKLGSTSVYAFSITKAGISKVHPVTIIPKGKKLTVEELLLRFSEFKGEILFDSVSPVQGVRAYLDSGKTDSEFKLEERKLKTVPYLRLNSYLGLPDLWPSSQIRYLKPLTSVRLAEGFYHRTYDTAGTNIVLDGFQLDVEGKSEMGVYPRLSANSGDLKHIQGQPLVITPLAANQVTYVSESAEIPLPSSQGAKESSTVGKVHVVPFTTLTTTNGKKASSNNVDLLFHTEGIKNGSIAIAGSIAISKTINLPFSSLAYTKILPAMRGKGMESYLILGFNKIPSDQRSRDLILSVKMTPKIVSNEGAPQMTLDLGTVGIISTTPVPKEDLIQHLRMSARGEYFWLEDPSADIDSSYYELRSFSDTKKILRGAQAASISTREVPDTVVANTFGRGARSNFVYSNWEVHNAFGLKDRITGANQLLEEAKTVSTSKSENPSEQTTEKPQEAVLQRPDGDLVKMAMNNFRELVGHIAGNPSNNSKINVVLVDPKMKAEYRAELVRALMSERSNSVSLQNAKFKFFVADGSLDDVEIGEEFNAIRLVSSGKKSLIYTEMKFLMDQVPVRTFDENGQNDDADLEEFIRSFDDPKSSSESFVFKHDKVSEPGDLSTLLASGGLAKSPGGFRKLGEQAEAIKRVPTIVLATPDEWRQLVETKSKAREAGVFSHFSETYDFLSSTWSLQHPLAKTTSEDVQQLSRGIYNPEEMRVFPSLDVLLEQAAEGKNKGKQFLVIVPKEVLPVVQKIALLRWASLSSVDSASPWTHSNLSLALFRLNMKEVTQDGIIDNLNAARGVAKSRNSVLMGDLETVMRLGRRTNSKGRNFILRDPARASEQGLFGSSVETLDEYRVENTDQASAARSISDDTSRGDATNNNGTAENKDVEEDQQANNKQLAPGRQYPHAMWLIASEGQKIQPKANADWSLSEAADLQATTIMFGTEEQLKQLESELEFEGRFLDLRKHFEMVALEPPDEQTKFQLVQDFLNKPEVRALGIEFKLSDSTGRGTNDQSQIVHHFINRVDQIAYDLKINKTSAFVRALVALKQSLAEDTSLRRSRVIDQNFVERVLSRVFPMPINPKTLDGSDVLVRAQDLDQLARDLQRAGYSGSPELKKRFLENMLSQTRAPDASRPIPNSQIIFGSTSTGKTFLLKTFFKMAGLVEYSSTRSSNEDAGYIFIQAGDLVDGTSTDPSKLTVDQAIENVMDLLSQPNGYRASIVIDDFHKSSPEVRIKLFRFVQGLFEAKQGLVIAKSKDGRRIKEVPVQNLNVYMTLNPTSNERIRAQYIQNNSKYSPAELLKREVLAAMSDNNFNPEESELARWSDIINMDSFPRSAKVPELGRRVREHARSDGALVLVDPAVIDALVTRFSNANARELLSPAAAALTYIPSPSPDTRLYTVTLRPGAMTRPNNNSVSNQINQTGLKEVVRSLSQIDPVSVSDPSAFGRFVSLALQNFRIQLFNEITLQSSVTDILKLNLKGMSTLLKSNFMIATSTHILDNPVLPLSTLRVTPDQLGFMSRDNQERFYQVIRPEKNTPSYFPKGFDQRSGIDDFRIEDFVSGNATGMLKTQTKKDVVTKFSRLIEGHLVFAMVKYLRLSSVDELRDLSSWNETKIRDWFMRLSDKNPEVEFSKISQDILDLFLSFQVEFNSPDLAALDDENGLTTTIYDEVRLFSYMTDKAISRLPWSGIGKFILDVVELSSDRSLGTRNSFKEYLSVHTISPFNPTSPEFMREMGEIGISFQTEIDDPNDIESRLENLRSDFGVMCEKLFK